MNIYALVIGLIIVTYVIVRFKKTRLERTKWAYPIFLASFPLYYVAFSVYGNDISALWKELLVGVLFFSIAYIAFKSQRKISVLLIGIGTILHAFYDYWHDLLFINAGTPDWWIEFCGSIDLILGLYLIYIGLKLPNKVLKPAREIA